MKKKKRRRRRKNKAIRAIDKGTNNELMKIV